MFFQVQNKLQLVWPDVNQIARGIFNICTKNIDSDFKTLLSE